MTTLILAEHSSGSLKPATLCAVTAAREIGGDVHVLVAGGSGTVAAAAAVTQGVTKVLHAEASHLNDGTAEDIAATASAVVKARGHSHIVAAATGFGRNVMPRIAAALDVEHIADIVSVEAQDTFVRPTYAGAVLATVQSLDPVLVITIRPTSFEPAPVSSGIVAPIEAIEAAPNSGLVRLVGRDIGRSDHPDLANARVVVAGGRALGSAENFKMLDVLAARLNGAVGASRAAVDAGYVGNHLQVGQSGKIVSPDLYIAVGISGAVQHLAGMKDSKIIVAINKDPEAPMFQIADYGLVGDLFEVVPALIGELGVR